MAPKPQKLMQVLATEKAVRNAGENAFTVVYRDVQKGELVNGFAKQYKPRKEGDEVFAPERKLVQVVVEDQIKVLARALIDLFDVTATKDYANTAARADVVVDGTTLLTGVPTTHLLFVEKKLVALIDFAKKLPTLSADEQWAADGALGLWTTPPAQTIRTKKVTRFDVVVPSTKEHPAQVKEVSEDIIIGDWTTTKHSGALTRGRAEAIVERAEKLLRAVKYAREEANTVEAPPVKTGAAILGYVFGVGD